jgi:UDPglucose 6-dehydrogenase
MRIAMIGTGYVGLVSGACFSDFGHVVTCIDSDAAKIRQLRSGSLPIFEPGLDALVANNVEAGRLSFTTEFAAPIHAADAIFLAVGTPSRRGDGFADLSYVYDAARGIAPEIKGYTVVAIKSTVPVGTNDEVDAIIRKLRPDADFAVVSNPEFLREGAAIEDFKRPDRIVIGTDDERARRVMRELYRPLFINETPILFTGRRAAELIKYASNAFLATKITFINEMADLCEKCGADVQEVARGMGLDRRIAGKFLHAGPGFGGSCFPKDIAALAAIGQHYGVPTKIVATVMEAPSLVIVPALEAQGARVRAYDPHGMEEARKLMPRLETAADPYACIEGADAMLILTEWDQFRALDLDRVKTALRSPVIIDLRNIYRPAEVAAKGLTYVSVGRG